MDEKSDVFIPLLTAIAAALDVPVTVFLSDPSRNDDEDIIALLRAWASINDPQGRQHLLNVARLEVARDRTPSRDGVLRT
jgi:hypothetical protein